MIALQTKSSLAYPPPPPPPPPPLPHVEAGRHPTAIPKTPPGYPTSHSIHRESRAGALDIDLHRNGDNADPFVRRSRGLEAEQSHKALIATASWLYSLTFVPGESQGIGEGVRHDAITGVKETDRNGKDWTLEVKELPNTEGRQSSLHDEHLTRKRNSDEWDYEDDASKNNVRAGNQRSSKNNLGEGGQLRSWNDSNHQPALVQGSGGLVLSKLPDPTQMQMISIPNSLQRLLSNWTNLALEDIIAITADAQDNGENIVRSIEEEWDHGDVLDEGVTSAPRVGAGSDSDDSWYVRDIYRGRARRNDSGDRLRLHEAQRRLREAEDRLEKERREEETDRQEELLRRKLELKHRKDMDKREREDEVEKEKAKVDAKFARLEEILIAQQEAQIMKDKAQQQADAETIEKQIREKLTRLEALIVAQKDEQLARESAEKAKRAVEKAVAEQDMAKRLAEKKAAAEQAMHVLEATQRARDEAEKKAAEVHLKRQYELQAMLQACEENRDDYKKKLEALKDGQVKSAASKMLVRPSVPRGPTKYHMLLPPSTRRNAGDLGGLTSLLEENGMELNIDANIIDEFGNASFDQLIHANTSGAAEGSLQHSYISSTLLWSALPRHGRSELYDVLCKFGWQPVYMRSSGKVSCSSNNVLGINELTLRKRQRTDMVLWRSTHPHAVY